MKIISIVGACPQFIKCAPLSSELRKVHHEANCGSYSWFEFANGIFEMQDIDQHGGGVFHSRRGGAGSYKEGGWD